MRTFRLTYDHTHLAKVSIDDVTKIMPQIELMVKFWTGWQDLVEDCDDNFLRAWFHQLAEYVFEHGRAPTDNTEGYVKFADFGIKVFDIQRWEPDGDFRAQEYMHDGKLASI